LTLLSDLLPEYHYRELHEIEVDAPPERVFDAVRHMPVSKMPVANLLFRLRGMRGSSSVAVLERLPSSFAVLAEEPNRELVAGGIGKPWQLRGGGGVPALEDFVGFAEPGYAKMALNFRLDGRVLSTETRVFLTDEAARRAFRRYWLVIGPFSALIRRVWLRAIRRRAERGGPG
jgi:hypothetical protein